MTNIANLKSIDRSTLTDDQYEDLAIALENTDRGEENDFDISVKDLMVDEKGNYYYPCDFKYESQIEEVWGAPMQIGGYYANDFCKLEFTK